MNDRQVMATIVCWIGVLVLTSCTYRDLVQEMDDYAPPVVIGPSDLNPTPAISLPDPLEDSQQQIDQAHQRWRAAIDDRNWAGSYTDIPPGIVTAAADNARTLDLIGGRLPLDTLEHLILLRSPKVAGAVDRFKAALEGFDQVAQLDEILRQYAAFTEGTMPGVGPMTGMTDSIEMRFPYPGVAALKGQVAEKNVAAEWETLAIVRRDVLAQGRKAYWNLLYTRRAIGITRDTLGRLDQLESVATTRYGAGRTSYQDVVKIRIGREKLVEQLVTLKSQRVNLETELLALMDFKPGPAMGWPVTPSPSLSPPALDPLYTLAIKKRQELRRMRVMIGKMSRMVEMAETMISPSFSQNTSLFSDEAILQSGGLGMKPTFATTVSPARGKGLPKNAWFGTRDAFLTETRLKLGALTAELGDAEAQTRLMVRKAWFDLDRARREQALYKDRLLELSQTSLDVSTRGYESGNVSFADVIASYTGWLEVNLAGQRRASDVGVAWAELERRVGAPLLAQANTGSEN